MRLKFFCMRSYLGNFYMFVNFFLSVSTLNTVNRSLRAKVKFSIYSSTCIPFGIA